MVERVSGIVAARVAGAGLLLMAVLAMFANFFVVETLIVPDDAARTVRNILADEMLFRSGIFTFVLVAILDVIVAWALYVFFRPVDERLALLAAFLRLTYTAVFVMAISNFLGLVRLVSGSSQSAALEESQLHAQVTRSIESFTTGWTVGLMVFGLHLLVIGYLMIASGRMPRVIGVLLMASCAGYLIDSGAQILLPNYADYETLLLVVVALPGALGELSLALWLLLRGARVPATQLHAQPSTA